MPRRQLASAARNLSVLGPASRALSRSPSSASPLSEPVSAGDTIYIEYFRRVTVPSAVRVFPSTFWSQIALQVAETDSAVWHSVIALGILHRCTRPLSPGNEDYGALISRAEKYYGKALSLATELNSAAKTATLCVVLVAVANMIGKRTEAQQHIIAGLSIIGNDSGQTPALNPSRETLPRTELQVMTFGESTAPYPFDQSTAALSPQGALQTPTWQGASYESFVTEFFGIARAYYLHDDCLHDKQLQYGPWLAGTDELLRRLAIWERSLMSFEATYSPGPEDCRTKLSLRLFHATLHLMLKATPFGPETRFDNHLGICEYIVRYAATVASELTRAGSGDSSISFEPGVVLPLWVVTHRCRHARLRHASLRILASLHRTEAIWNSDMAAAIMEDVLATEEDGVKASLVEPYVPTPVDPDAPEIPLTAWQSPNFVITPTVSWEEVPFVPESKRVKDVMGIPDFNRRTMELALFTAPTGDAEGYGSMKQSIVTF